MDCHSCSASMGRNDEACSNCGWHNVIQCPVDETKLTPTHDEEVKVDLCPKCRGVWFDNTELAELWNRQIKLHTGGKAKTIESNHFFMVDMLDIDVPKRRGIGRNWSNGTDQPGFWRGNRAGR